MPSAFFRFIMKELHQVDRLRKCIFISEGQLHKLQDRKAEATLFLQVLTCYHNKPLLLLFLTILKLDFYFQVLSEQVHHHRLHVTSDATAIPVGGKNSLV